MTYIYQMPVMVGILSLQHRLDRIRGTPSFGRMIDSERCPMTSLVLILRLVRLLLKMRKRQNIRIKWLTRDLVDSQVVLCRLETRELDIVGKETWKERWYLIMSHSGHDWSTIATRARANLSAVSVCTRMSAHRWKPYIRKKKICWCTPTCGKLLTTESRRRHDKDLTPAEYTYRQDSESDEGSTTFHRQRTRVRHAPSCSSTDYDLHYSRIIYFQNPPLKTMRC